MFSLLLVAQVVGLFVGNAICVVEIPKDYKRCKIGPDFNVCVASAMNDALPKLVTEYKALGLPQLEPFTFSAIKFEQQNGPVSIKQEFRNLRLFNVLLKTHIEQFNLDLAKHQIDLIMFKEQLDVVADCVMDGRILVVPIQGHGPCTQNYTDIRFDLKLKFQIVEKNGENYWHFKSAETRIRMPKKVVMHFDNLFNGNQELTESTNKFINENWRDIFKELEPVYAQAFSKLTLKIFNTFFDQLSISKIFPE